jgi:hypothetical protein
VIDPIISLAFSIHANPGAYAVLIGSGISSSAGIPTGWQIVEDLVRRIAHVRGEDASADPAAWYRSTFGVDPEYSRLLDELARSSLERSQLLRSYFEPTPEEREASVKMPVAAHRALATLAAKGYIRVLLTTNFDPLLEQALEQAGVVPTVLATPDAVAGALPLTQAGTTLVKVHGHYLDTRIKNTPAELDVYDPAVDALLDRVFDEFGLIVCGWSATWDTALRRAIERCPSHRYITYWATRGAPTPEAARLIQLRRAVQIPITSADVFFTDLAEKVLALEELDRPHPTSTAMAVASLKRYLGEERHRIRVHDLVWDEAARVREAIADEHFPTAGVPFSPTELQARVARYEAVAQTLSAIFAVGCYWTPPGQIDVWAKTLEHVAAPTTWSGTEVWLALRRYPALVMLYAGGVSAVAGGRDDVLAGLLRQARFRDLNAEVPLVLGVNTWRVMEHQTAQLLPGQERKYTPLSNHLFQVVRAPLRDVIVDDRDYEHTFDRFEYLLGLVHADLYKEFRGSYHSPVGMFHWRHEYQPDRSIAQAVEAELDHQGERWGPIAAGLFEGSWARLKEAKAAYDEQLARTQWS